MFFYFVKKPLIGFLFANLRTRESLISLEWISLYLFQIGEVEEYFSNRVRGKLF